MTAAMDLDGNCETAKALRFTLVSLGPKVPPDYHWKLQHYPIHCMPYQSQRALKLPPFCRNCCRSTIPILVKHRLAVVATTFRFLNESSTKREQARCQQSLNGSMRNSKLLVLALYRLLDSVSFYQRTFWSQWSQHISALLPLIDKPWSSSKRFDGLPTRLQVMSWKSHTLESALQWVLRCGRSGGWKGCPSCPFSQDNWPQPKESGLEAGKETARHTANISPSTFRRAIILYLSILSWFAVQYI